MSHSSFEIWKAVLEDPKSQLPQGMLMSGCDHTCQPRRDDSPVANLLRHMHTGLCSGISN